jgi:hypothetical protein
MLGFTVPRFLHECSFSALRAAHPLSPGRFLELISVRGLVDPRAIVRLEGLSQFKKPVTCDLPACNMVPQPTTIPRTPKELRATKQILK